MGAERKREVIDLVRRSPLSKRHTLEELGIPRSTYFRWQRRSRQQGEVDLVDRRPLPGDSYLSMAASLSFTNRNFDGSPVFGRRV